MTDDFFYFCPLVKPYLDMDREQYSNTKFDSGYFAYVYSHRFGDNTKLDDSFRLL